MALLYTFVGEADTLFRVTQGTIIYSYSITFEMFLNNLRDQGLARTNWVLADALLKVMLNRLRIFGVVYGQRIVIMMQRHFPRDNQACLSLLRLI